MRTWNTLPTAPPQWGKIQGIPSDFSDGKIDWEEVQNKPTNFPSLNHIHAPQTGSYGVEIYNNTTTFGEAMIGLVSGSNGGRVERSTTNGHYVIYIDGNDDSDSFAIVSRSTSSADTGQNPDRLIFRIFRNGRILASLLPTSPTGLQSGTFWRDSNGFLRIV